MSWILIVGAALFLLWLMWDWVVSFLAFGLFVVLAVMAIAGIGYGLWAVLKWLEVK